MRFPLCKSSRDRCLLGISGFESEGASTTPIVFELDGLAGWIKWLAARLMNRIGHWPEPVFAQCLTSLIPHSNCWIRVVTVRRVGCAHCQNSDLHACLTLIIWRHPFSPQLHYSPCFVLCWSARSNCRWEGIRWALMHPFSDSRSKIPLQAHKLRIILLHRTPFMYKLFYSIFYFSPLLISVNLELSQFVFLGRRLAGGGSKRRFVLEIGLANKRL